MLNSPQVCVLYMLYRLFYKRCKGNLKPRSFQRCSKVNTKSVFSSLMPQDSTYILDNLADTAGLPDTFRVLLKEVQQSTVHGASKTSVNAYSTQNNGNGIPWEPIIVFLMFVSVYVLLKYLRYKFLTKKISRIYEEKRFVYHDILNNHNPYYKSLGTENKDRFIRRVIFFIQAKDFKYIGIEKEEQIPLLISATAIQLTFGLNHYLLDYFKTIYILKDNYRYGLSAVPFEGHVNDDGIIFPGIILSANILIILMEKMW